MAGVIFEDNTFKIINTIDEKIDIALEECAGEIESATKRNSRVDTGQTKNSFQHVINDHTAYIGSNYQNAIWEEFGTGEYALKGDGRKGGWHYRDERGEWHFTRGKTPRRAFWNAYTAKKTKILKHIQNTFKGGLS